MDVLGSTAKGSFFLHNIFFAKRKMLLPPKSGLTRRKIPERASIANNIIAIKNTIFPNFIRNNINKYFY